MYQALFTELICKAAALIFTAWVANILATEYTNAVVEAGRAYLTIVEILYTRERLPPRV